MSEKLDEIAVFNESGVCETEVIIQVDSLAELPGTLSTVDNLKEKYPYTKFRIEVLSH